MLIKKATRFFYRMGDKIRGMLSHYPVLYALIGGIGVILFWRGVWHMADDAGMSSIVATIIGAIILLVSGVFVSTFIGSRLIITGLIGEKRLTEKEVSEIETEKGEIETEETQIRNLQNTLNRLEKKLDHIDKEVEEK